MVGKKKLHRWTTENQKLALSGPDRTVETVPEPKQIHLQAEVDVKCPFFGVWSI